MEVHHLLLHLHGTCVVASVYALLCLLFSEIDPGVLHQALFILALANVDLTSLSGHVYLTLGLDVAGVHIFKRVSGTYATFGLVRDHFVIG